ncbi:SRPBCC family protein [Streptomyces sp. CC224B]|uniref:aromatase/cyclase n=1 Tax=Streptomyces sp. CC224B TaxID=3044571 RepID=UPI0024A7E87F|nr:SRPBCC family protein [Streptomyces sp. CC224B]
MSGERVHRISHAVDVAAPAGVVYALVADPVRWPLYFPANVHVEQLDYDGTQERLRMWVLADGQVRSWISSRVQDAARRTVTYQQDLLMEPAASMGGTWTITEDGPQRCRLHLEHAFSAVGDRPESVAWLTRATSANARADLDSLRTVAQRFGRLDALTLSFEESLRVNGPPELLYSFLYDVLNWSTRLPHVAGVEVDEPRAGIQNVTMQVHRPPTPAPATAAPAPAAAVRTVRSVRVCFPHAQRIVFKELDPGGLLAAHRGEWSVLPDPGGVTVSAQHHVVLREDALPPAAGPAHLRSTDAPRSARAARREHEALTQVRRQVCQELGRDSRSVLQAARAHAESAIRAYALPR